MNAYPKPMSQKEIQAQEQKWQAEADVHTLIEAAKIRKDPEREKRAMECLKQKRAELDNIKV